MNGSVAHIVVVAKDSGIPARQTSVPVIVHFPSGSVSAQPRSLEQNVFMVTLVLGLISGLLLIVIFSMLVYICKSKKGSRLHPPSSTPSADQSGHMSKHLMKPSSSGPGARTQIVPVPNGGLATKLILATFLQSSAIWKAATAAAA